MNRLIEPVVKQFKTSDTAIVITAYYPKESAADKIYMTKKLCQSFKKSPHLIVLASHSPMPVDVQELVDLYVYDNDNEPYWNGVPKKAMQPYMKWDEETGALNAFYGIAELKSVHNAINALKKYPNVKNILKIAYDESPATDHHSIIEKAKKTKKRAVLAELRDRINGWGTIKDKLGIKNLPRGSFGTHIFYCEVDFFMETLSIDEIHRYDDEVVPWLECVWYSSIADKKLLDQVYVSEGYYNYMGEVINQYNDSSNSIINAYPF